ncbi:hypothetical protein CLIB1423_05S06942 [[Candida] railenensis]|uniref:Transcription regulator Rua1 C-terminal domain-containing protein n=1 Tax=[Candida] railenensis TaxID=45579 RepID=A0A9P0QMU4_9ASCO|nr:hypothetical protein CLIB1423_05S06942 [[Candida] railenensis]
MSKSAFVPSDLLNYEDLNDLNFAEDPFDHYFKSLLSPKSTFYSFEGPDKIIDLSVESTNNSNFSSETLNGDEISTSVPSFDPNIKYSDLKIFQDKQFNISWDESTVNFDSDQTADHVPCFNENKSEVEETSHQHFFKFLEAETGIEFNDLIPKAQVESVSDFTKPLKGESEAQGFQNELELDFTDFEFTAFPGMEDIFNFSKSQADVDESTLCSNFPVDFPSIGSNINNLWNYPTGSGDLLDERFTMEHEPALEREGNLKREPEIESTRFCAGVASTPSVLPPADPIPNAIKRSPNQSHSPPKRMHAIGKVKSRRGSYNEQKRIPLDYSKVKLDNLIVQTNNLRNFAYVKPPMPIEELVRNKVIRFKTSDNNRITQIKRTRYIRSDLSSLASLYHNVRYEKNPCFGLDRPYEPEFISYEVDTTTELPFNETRCGLCPYCPDLKFRNFKTSTYSQHLALWHGIHTDNYLTPNPSHYGVYKLSKDKNIEKRKTVAHLASKNGVVCPVCHDIIETECSKSTLDKPLSGYLRHFRDHHRRSNFKWDPYQYFTITVE